MLTKRIYFLCLFLALCGRPCFASVEAMDKIVAVVNGDIITEEELALFMKMAVMEHDSELIEDRLILQEAKNKQLKADPTQVEDHIRDIKRRAGSEIAFEEALKTQGVSLSDLREKITNQMLIYNLIQKEVKSRAQVSPKEVTDYFQQHAGEFMTPETVVVDSIFVDNKDDLRKVQADLASGKDFNEVAKSYSKKSSLGNVARGQLKKNLEDVIFSLGAGQCSKPVEVEDGIYLFSVKEKLAPSQKSIDDVRDKIAAVLTDAKIGKDLKEWIEGLKDKAYISIRE